MATLRKRDDRWQARIQRKGYTPLTKSFLTRQDAQKWARLTESELERDLYICPKEAQRTTLADALDRYEREVSAFKRSHSVEKYYIQHWRDSRIAPLALSAIRGSDVATYRDHRLKLGLSPTSVRHELALLSHVFSVAAKEWGMESLTNPVRAIRLPNMARGRERRVTDAEIEAICNVASPELSAMIRLALHTAMRRGELLNLRWLDIDWQKAVATLEQTKNGDRRFVPLSSMAIAVIRGLPRRMDGKVFGLPQSNVSHGFLAAVRNARKAYESAGGNCPQYLLNLHFHDLRHEAASRLVERGFHPMEIMAITGHRDTQMLKRYVHPIAHNLALRLG